MAEVAGRAETQAATVSTRGLSTTGEDLGTVLATCLLLAGAGLDARAHALGRLETFFTPWHAALYSGFAATLAWITFISLRRQAQGRNILRSAPPGYEAAWIGLAMFAVGGIGDLAWHEAFGIEQDIAATFSPTHLFLFVGAILIISSPLRAALKKDAEAAPFTAIASAALVVTITSLVLTWLSPLVFPDAASFGLERGGIASLLVTNVVVVGPPLWLLSRWRLPPGTFLVILVIPAIAVVLANTPSHWPLIGAFAVAGVIADVLAAAIGVSPARPHVFRGFGATLAVLVWGAYFAFLGQWRTLGWEIELWAGSIVLSGLSALVLAQLLLARADYPADWAGGD